MKSLRVISLVLIAVIFVSTIAFAVVGKTETKEKPKLLGTPVSFITLLEKGITNEISDKVVSAFQPLVGVVGTQLLGLPESVSLNDIKKQLDSIESKLDSLKKEVADGFEKVLAEIDKNNKMQTAINALARGEQLAKLLLTSNEEEVTQNIEDLSAAEQTRLVEINASIISKKNVDELLDVLTVAKEYLSSGYIDTNYKNAFELYYDYMKKQSMFCGEAAMLAQDYWQIMIESYAKSCVALLVALEQQDVMYALSESTAGHGITQEAIDAAAVAKEFGTHNVIQKRIETVKKDSLVVIMGYRKFLEEAKKEETVFINKNSCYIRLNPEMGIVDFNNLSDYDTYLSSVDFESDGISESLYQSTLEANRYYYFGDRFFHIDLQSVPYDDFINNYGTCDYYSTHFTELKPYDIKEERAWRDCSSMIFKNVMLNLKGVQYNSANKLSYESVIALVEHIREKHPTKTIAEFLVSIGFDFKGRNISEENALYLLNADIKTGDALNKISSGGKMYDLADLSKKGQAFSSVMDIQNPAGSLVYFENANDSIRIAIHSDGMDNRIYKGVYTITAKQYMGDTKDGKPEYSHYEKIVEISGTKSEYVNLPANIEFSTIRINLGYEGLGASKNHASLCSYEFKELEEAPAKITLKMRGYTKWWGGYGVDATISCDGTVLATGVG